tara:strand:- start:873 stop:1241 length:369 start_codon:yes stop_codon:yes gene_type:complete
MNVSTPTAAQRRDAMARHLEDLDAIERLVRVRQRRDSMRQKLTAMHGPELAERGMQVFSDCKAQVIRANALARRCEIDDGRLIAVGIKAPSIMWQLESFNQREKGSMSLAAIVHNMLHRGEL